MVSVARRDLQYRGMRDDRLRSFSLKQEANFLLYRKVKHCSDEHEYQMYQQAWDTVNRPRYRDLQWSEKQKDDGTINKAVAPSSQA